VKGESWVASPVERLAGILWRGNMENSEGEVAGSG